MKRSKKVLIAIISAAVIGSIGFSQLKEKNNSKQIANLEEVSSEDVKDEDIDSKNITVECKGYESDTFEIKINRNINELLNKYLEEEYKEKSFVQVVGSKILKQNGKEAVIEVISTILPKEKNKIKFLNKNRIGEDGASYIELCLEIEEVGENKLKIKEVLSLDEAKKSLGLEDKDILRLEETDSLCQIKPNVEDILFTTDGWRTSKEAPIKIADIASETGKLEIGSYFISKDKIAFIYGDREILISEDGGKTYRETSLPKDDKYPPRRQFIGFNDEGLCYALVTSGKVMSQEGSTVYISKDNGKTFKEVGSFVSSLVNRFNIINDKVWYIETKTGLRKTEDCGKTLEDIEIPCKGEFLEYYDTLMPPTFKGNEGVMYVSQGEDSDYGAGSKQVAKLITKDGGKTWTYVGEVIL
ncbi:hypothetical protein [uncultured Clostridium sp.]|uniref:hypothetical protein n=1 Tax=uncultured Clostridium sp. TaxID=59620 RepID=UPI0025838613|nr:hypothetical protein [uncultured Clostridium sp.]